MVAVMEWGARTIMGGGLRGALGSGAGETLLFGVTPPRSSTPGERVREIAATTVARLASVPVDGLVLYDIDDESDRNPEERPFPYLPTLDPVRYHAEFLRDWDRDTVIYRCVGKYRDDELAEWMREVDAERVLTVFVGASSKNKATRTSLTRAHELRREVRDELSLGGVVIPERDAEHERLLVKQGRGCEFFISQVVYNADAAKSLVSDYFYTCQEQGLRPRPVIFTLSVCGSVKTLAFLRWLGVDVPRWLENALRHAPDTLTESYRNCLETAQNLTAFCRGLGMPFGFLVESVSIRKAEIEASVELARDLAGILGRTGNGTRGVV